MDPAVARESHFALHFWLGMTVNIKCVTDTRSMCVNRDKIIAFPSLCLPLCSSSNRVCVKEPSKCVAFEINEWEGNNCHFIRSCSA